MFAVYHGPDGLRRIGGRVHAQARALANGLRQLGQAVESEHFFDTITVALGQAADGVIAEAIDGFVSEEAPIDFVDRFGFPVPLRVISDRLGVPPEDRAFFYDGATAAAALLRMTVPAPEEMLRRSQLGAELESYMVELVQKRRNDPKEDLATALATARMRALGVRLWRAAKSSLVTSTAEAPSVSGDEVPAVTVPMSSPGTSATTRWTVARGSTRSRKPPTSTSP